MDVHRPDRPEPAPVVMWVHGGGWVGGSKEELATYLQVIASAGFAVVAPRYSLAPEHRPELGHEYQLDLDADAGTLVLGRMVAFLERRLGPVA
jgi:poly(3-hydroxybutyrate) depolymerase